MNTWLWITINALLVWIILGVLTLVLVLWGKPPKDVVRLWPILLVALGPVGLVCFIVQLIESYRERVGR